MVWRGEPRSCSFSLHEDQFVSAVYNPNAQTEKGEGGRERGKRRWNWPNLCWVEWDTAAGVEIKRKVLISVLYTWMSSFTSWSDPSRLSLTELYRRVSMHLHTAAAVYKEATRPASERGSTSFFPFSTPFTCKMKTVAKWWNRSAELNPRVKTVRVKVIGSVRIPRVSHKFICRTWKSSWRHKVKRGSRPAGRTRSPALNSCKQIFY